MYSSNGMNVAKILPYVIVVLGNMEREEESI